MIRFLKKSILIIAEVISLVLSVLWYLKTTDYEPLIAIIATSASLISSLSLKLFSRPKIELYQEMGDYGRNNQGFSVNNPQIITLGVDRVNIYWKLFWNYSIEIRNNSSHNAYSISFEYINLPDKTYIENEIGAIEPILSNEKKTARLKLVQKVEGNFELADQYLRDNAHILLSDVKIIVKYKDEFGSKYYTKFEWRNNQNKFTICK